MNIPRLALSLQVVTITVLMAALFLFLSIALVISFICSILESTLLSTPLSFITMREEEGFRPAVRFKKFKTEPDKPIAAILALNTIANTIGSAGVGRQATLLFGSEWFGLVSAIVTLLILVIAEIIPKTIGTTYWKKLMGFTVRSISLIIVLMYPLVLLVKLISNLITPSEEEASVSREEVSAMANIGEEEGVIEENENKIIQNLIKLDKVKAYDAMTPRVVSAIAPESMTVKEFYKDNEYLHHSRIPVYSESPDFITGYILRSEALERLADDKFNVRLKDIRRDIKFFSDEASLGDIWDELLKGKEQISVIIDEYGCFEGILTLEDILETILGLEIVDESDTVSDMQQYARERWQMRQKRIEKKKKE